MGFFELCNHGTLFFDEIADMPINLQSKILRATEEKVITRVGDTGLIHTDFRIISATNHDIEIRVAEKKFRLDLFHRLNTLHIHIPALRERPEDIEPLLNHFVDVYATKFNRPKLNVSGEVLDALLKYDFPGNVRELKNLTERAIILCKGNLLGINDFPVKPQKISTSEIYDDAVNLKHMEINTIRKALKSCNFNQSAAADKLGITRDALSRKMKKFKIIVNKGEE
jgi:transcriptional regulator with PAS, ATPase and Fis domain